MVSHSDKKSKSVIKRLRQLPSVEARAFWVISFVYILVGIISFITTFFYDSRIPAIVSTAILIIAPGTLIFLIKKKNIPYSRVYPILCIIVGGIGCPIEFFINGGFDSGMVVYCLVVTAACAFCSTKKWRFISLATNMVGNTAAFVMCWLIPSPYPLSGTTAIRQDIGLGYYLCAISIVLSISLVTSEVDLYRRKQSVLDQYFDPEVQKQILEGTDLSNPNGEKREAIILFSDISRFTSTTEKMQPEETAELLNDFFSIAEKSIHENGGIIDKFIGDCVMAYWFSADEKMCARNAVRAVLAMKQEMYHKSEEIFAKYGTEVNFSSGIAYGNVIFGNIGSEKICTYTIIGDAVNTASRIEGYANAGELLLSDKAADLVADFAEMEQVTANLYLQGKNEPVNLYRVVKLFQSKTNGQKEENMSDVVHNKLCGYSLHICGCRGSFPVSGLRFSEYGGETSCYLLRRNDYAIIIDCGTGLKNAVRLLDGCKKVDILLTHLHYDHILGLLSSQFPADIQIRILGHFSGWIPGTEALSDFMNHPFWPIGVHPMESVNVVLEKEIPLCENVVATFYKSDHPDNGCVIKLMCEDKKICILADCENVDRLDAEIARNSDVLLFDGMYDDNDAVDHTGWGHGTWQKAIRFGIAENIQKLVITHHNPEHGDFTMHKKEEQAKRMMRNVSFAKTGDCIKI